MRIYLNLERCERREELLACNDGNQEDIDLAKERKLDSKKGANDIYKIAKARERKSMDIGNMRYIKDEGGQTIMKEEDIRKRWGEYFQSLFNESSPIEGRSKRRRDVGSARHQMHYDCYYSRINQGEVLGRRGGEVADVPLQQDLLRRKDA
ncbi:hypothetical protein Tco_0106398 [Tanacetum coccineum]